MSTNTKPQFKYTKATPVKVADWHVENTKYKAAVSTPKMTRIGVLNGTTNRAITLELPLLTSYGIKDFVEEGKDGNPDKGNDKFSLSLQLPDPNSPDLTEAKRQEVITLINKLKELEAKILNDCVINQSQWFKEEGLSLDVMKSKMFPILKYPKIKDAMGKPTKKPDYSRPPTISISVPKWDGVWNVELYDNSRPAPKLIFPNAGSIDEDGNTVLVEPPELVPMFSKVKASITCGGIWVGDKTCGVTFKLIEGIVVPSSVTSAPGQCGIVLDDEDSQPTMTEDDGEKALPKPVQVTNNTSGDVPITLTTQNKNDQKKHEEEDDEDSEDDASTSSSRIGKNDDNEDEDEDADEPIAVVVPPVPPPAVVKRVINKVKPVEPVESTPAPVVTAPVKTTVKKVVVKK